MKTKEGGSCLGSWYLVSEEAKPFVVRLEGLGPLVSVLEAHRRSPTLAVRCSPGSQLVVVRRDAWGVPGSPAGAAGPGRGNPGGQTFLWKITAR